MSMGERWVISGPSVDGSVVKGENMDNNEKRCSSKIELCLHDVSPTEAWKLIYIVIRLLKDKNNIHKIYQQLVENEPVDDTKEE